MLSRVVVVGVTCALLSASAAQALSSSDRITKDGLGDLKIGMSISQTGAALGKTLDVERTDGSACGTAALGSKVLGLFTGSTLTRIYINTPRYQTRKGVHVGDRASDVYAAYGKNVSSQPHKYVRGGRYLRVTTKRRRVVFETSGTGRITSISTGRTPEVDLVEGCA